jgi:hypothetical protein
MLRDESWREGDDISEDESNMATILSTIWVVSSEDGRRAEGPLFVGVKDFEDLKSTGTYNPQRKMKSRF